MNNRLKLIELNNKQSKPKNRFTIKRFINRIIPKLYWILHIFGCPKKYLTEPYIVRYCHKCSRLRFTDRKYKKLFMQGYKKGKIDYKRSADSSSATVGGVIPTVDEHKVVNKK